jgi:ribonuclease J
MITSYKPKSRTAPRGSANSRGRNTQVKRRISTNKQKINQKTVFSKGKLRVIVLGGLEEVGRNMTLIEYNKEIIIIDMGLQFPEEDMPGIDYIIPNITYLENKTDWIKGVIITHGHMDHIGGIPHIMGRIGNPPMYTGKLTAGIIRKRCEEYRQCPKLGIVEVDDSKSIKIGSNFQVEFLRVNHSIPDSFAIIIKTPIGTVFHTGDFKIDYSPVNDKPADLNRIALLGSQGVDLMMADSTDSTHPGYQLSESAIGDEINRIFDNLSGRIIIGTFASQLSRIQKIFDLAKKHNRRVYLQGRSMNNNVEIAHGIGYLKFSPNLLIRDADLKRLPDKKILILGTGAQGESNAFLKKVVSREHKTIQLKKGDTIIFSSSIIPGNERSIQNLKDMVVRQGARVVHYQMMDVHAGGHAKQEDLKLMMRLVKPKFFMPIEGSHYMLQAHADLAAQVGIPEKNIFVPDNGQVTEMYKQGNMLLGKITAEKVPSDYVMVDGLGVGDVSNIVLRDRRVMAEDGMIVAIATIDSKTGEPIGNPDIISRGFVYMKENRQLIEDTRMKIKKIVKEHDPRTASRQRSY